DATAKARPACTHASRTWHRHARETALAGVSLRRAYGSFPLRRPHSSEAVDQTLLLRDSLEAQSLEDRAGPAARLDGQSGSPSVAGSAPACADEGAVDTPPTNVRADRPAAQVDRDAGEQRSPDADDLPVDDGDEDANDGPVGLVQIPHR